MQNLPPPLPFNGLRSNTVLRGSVLLKIQENSLVVNDFTVVTALGGYPQLKSCFREIKVLMVKVWLVTTLPTSSSGVISLCVAPKDMINTKDTYAGFSCTPGVMTRKSYQTLHGKWYPTEPDERNWFPVDADKHLFAIQIFGKDLPKVGTSTEVEVQIIYDAHVLFRGRASPSTVADEFQFVDGISSMNVN